MMIEKVKDEVRSLLCGDGTGHGFDHIERVLRLSLKFADKERANKDVVALIALLHDVDDYKLFGADGANTLPNARAIMKKSAIAPDIQAQVLDAISKIGYNKSLSGIRPTTLEGMIVSDADMCDALGVNGVIRAYRYSLKDGKPFFDKTAFPLENMTADQYRTHDSDSTVCHIFEKILKLKGMMMTDVGRREAQSRHEIVLDILYHLFSEENAPEWMEYLNKKVAEN